MPSGGPLEGGGAATVDRLRAARRSSGTTSRARSSGLWTVEAWTFARFGRTLTTLSPDARERAVLRWSDNGSRYARWLLRAILTPIKIGALRRPGDVRARRLPLGSRRPAKNEPPRWMRRSPTAATVDGGPRARVRGRRRRHGRRRRRGGLRARAARARGAAARGGRLPPAHELQRPRRRRRYQKLYRDQGLDLRARQRRHPGLGRARASAGARSINSGTCYRAPERTLRSAGASATASGDVLDRARSRRTTSASRRCSASRRPTRDHLGGIGARSSRAAPTTSALAPRRSTATRPTATARACAASAARPAPSAPPT